MKEVEFGTLILLKIIYLFLAVLDLCCCAQASSSCSEQELLLVVVLVAAHRLSLVAVSRDDSPFAV